jgi:DNA (cytosine-5)-methyltransferase 1
MIAFYNEIDPYAAQWLRNLINKGHIAPGVVDERPIQEIEFWELQKYTQCHFFAGIGVWSYALRRAGWPDDQPIWTGSCPCQPFSQAGKQKGFSDDRHLWPYWEKLIAECKPSIIVGEQVASALEWLDLVSTNLEASGYAFGAADLCAAGFDGAHIRQRNYFVGLRHAERDGRQQRRAKPSEWGIVSDSAISGLADDDEGSQRRRLRGDSANQRAIGATSMVGGLADDDDRQNNSGRGILGFEESLGAGDRFTCERPSGLRKNCNTDAPMLGRMSVDWLYCRDGKWRPVEPGTFPLAHEASARVGRLRTYGNALDAETATQFCAAIKEICEEV